MAPRLTLLLTVILFSATLAVAQSVDAPGMQKGVTPSRIGQMPEIAGVTLPPQQPLLNAPQRYPVGNGIAMAIYSPTGEIEAVFGPGYSTSDLIQNEDFLLEVDQVELPLRVEMRRAEKTGVFYGFTTRGDLDVGIVDFAGAGQPWISRLIVFKNTSRTASHEVVLRNRVSPRMDANSRNLVANAAGQPTGYHILVDTSVGVPWGTNPVEKSVVVAWSDPASSALPGDRKATLQTQPVRLAPQAQSDATLTHYFYSGWTTNPTDALQAIQGLDHRANLRECIESWQAWFEKVPPAYSLSKVRDDRCRVLIEGGLAMIKTNQSADGGVLATPTFYKMGYVRDGAMGVIGLLALGHTEEARRWLQWMDHKIATHGYLGNAMNCEVSFDIKSDILGLGNTNVELPGWILLVARDYYAQTRDLAFLKSIDRTLRLCADKQLQEAAANDYKLSFNGDETEICGAVNIRSTGTPGNASSSEKDYALSSVAMAAASIEFFGEYIKASGDNPAQYENAINHATVNLDQEVKKLVSAMHRDFWRTDVSGASAGFHDSFRSKSDGTWPTGRIVNFTLMPAFFGTPYPLEEKRKDTAAMADLFDQKTGFLQLVPGENNGLEGHTLGYLLWSLLEVGDQRQELVYRALVNGATVDCWGSFAEAYDRAGHPNDHDLRPLETGINVSALAKYWKLGSEAK